jgi:hypothetical protein
MGDSTGISWTDATWARFLGNVDKTDACWNWTAGTFSTGYGQYRVGARKVRTHRAAYERLVGPIPVGMRVCHRCDNKRCCNPDHLFLGTDLDNARDRDAKGRGRAIPPAAMTGAANPAAKLGPAEVFEIRRAARHETQRSLAKRFGVSQSQIGNIVRGTSWRSRG